MQIPPMWSALKVGGRRLHTLARRGIEIDRAPRAVTIHEITPSAFDLPKVRFTVVCTKGTYVRSLVNDIGGFLGCGAYLSGLIRTRIGDFHLSDALSVNDLIEYQTMRRTTPA
jgi:tRNA pseudouridine55 synthase